jgi:hypothetical protein|tara:strand:+ start:99 stop:299 length:201 start_codon:yes stop_codon:yes gene_type:complete
MTKNEPNHIMFGGYGGALIITALNTMERNRCTVRTKFSMIALLNPTTCAHAFVTQKFKTMTQKRRT